MVSSSWQIATRRRTAVGVSLIFLLIAVSVVAQETSVSGKGGQKTGVQALAADILELREALAAQQQQIAAQREEIERLREELRSAQRQMTQKLEEAQGANEQSHKILAAGGASLSALAELNKKVEADVSEVRTAVAATTSLAERAQEASSTAMKSGFGHVRFNGLVQIWGSAGDAGYRDSFRIRRTELTLSGQINDKVRWAIMVDPAKSLSLNSSSAFMNGTTVLSGSSVNQASRILQDAFVSTTYIPHLRVDVGQFKIPLSMESGESSASLSTFERALFMSDRARGGSFGDIRDIGVMLSGALTKYADFYVGEFNSSGDRQNDVAVNDQKATIGRLVIKPVKWLQIGGSGAYGNGGSRPDRPRRDRLGAEFLIRHAGFTVKSEYMQGKDANVLRQGYYALTSYRLRQRFEPVFRFDAFDPDVRHSNLNAATAPERDFIAGFNWYLSDTHFRIQTNYVRKTFAKDVMPGRNLVFVNLQTAW